jgi:hypothetical protein
MKPIKQIPNSELYFNLRQLSEIAKVVAYAKDEYEAEYFTINYLRPILEKTEKLLNNEQQVD